MSRLIRQLRRWPVIAAVVVIVVGGGSAAWALSRSSGSGNSSTQLVAAKVANVTQTVSASGTIAPAHQADLDFAVIGRVNKVLVKAGDKVRKGQALARVSKTALNAQRAAAVATVSSDSDKLASDSSGTAQATADAAALKAAKASLHTAKAAVQDATLRATIAGTVTSINLTVGQQVSGGGSGSSSDSSSSSQVEIQSSASFIVNATVDDTEISQVKKGQSVDVTPDGAALPVTGKVTSVSTVPSSQSGVVTFPITVRVSGHPAGVYAGASATLSITTRSVKNVLEIPTLAITYSGSTASVKVNNGGGAVTRTITVGETYGLETQVLSGMKSGDKVVVQIPTFGRIRTGGSGNTGGGGFARTFGGEGGSGGFPTGGGGGFPTGGFGGGGVGQ